MRIQVKRGAVISLIVDCAGHYNIEGAVIKMDDNEIILRPQYYVAVKGYTGQRYISYESIDQTVTSDGPYPDIHFDKSKVVGWSYVRLPNKDTAQNTTFSGFYYAHEVKLSKLNYYDSDGICRGEGDFLE